MQSGAAIKATILFNLESLDEAAFGANDEPRQIGAWVFQEMARQVYAREQQKRKQQVHQLRIEIDQGRGRPRSRNHRKA